MKRNILLMGMLAACLILMAGCGCQHEWMEADCLAPKTCTLCAQTEGDALGHSWQDATCTTPRTCSSCGETEGGALGHSWKPADCLTPETCTVCQATEGEALGHRFSHWEEAGDTMSRECAVCAEQETKPFDQMELLIDLIKGRWDCVTYLEIEEYPAEVLFEKIPYLEVFEDQTIFIFDGQQERRGTIRYREHYMKDDVNIHLYYAVLEDREWLLAYNFPRAGSDRPVAITGNLNTLFGLYRFEQINPEA